MPAFKHRCDLLGLSGDAQQDLPKVCEHLDKMSEDGWELVQILPMTMNQPSLRNGVLAGNQQSVFAAFMRCEAGSLEERITLDE